MVIFYDKSRDNIALQCTFYIFDDGFGISIHKLVFVSNFTLLP